MWRFAAIAPGRAVMTTVGLVTVTLLLASCEGASQVEKGAKDFDEAGQNALKEQQRQQQQKAEQEQQAKEMMERMQVECQDTPFLKVPEGPVRASDAVWPAGAVLLVADLQLAWGGGGGGGGNDHSKKKKYTPCP